MAQAIYAGAGEVAGVRSSLYDLEGSEVAPFVDLIEGADGLMFGTPTINGDSVKPVWELLSSLALIELRGKRGAVFGSFGWSGEAVGLVEDRLRGLKIKLPLGGKQLRLIPTAAELEECRLFGRAMAEALLTADE